MSRGAGLHVPSGPPVGLAVVSGMHLRSMCCLLRFPCMQARQAAGEPRRAHQHLQLQVHLQRGDRAALQGTHSASPPSPHRLSDWPQPNTHTHPLLLDKKSLLVLHWLLLAAPQFAGYSTALLLARVLCAPSMAGVSGTAALHRCHRSEAPLCPHVQRSLSLRPLPCAGRQEIPCVPLPAKLAPQLTFRTLFFGCVIHNPLNVSHLLCRTTLCACPPSWPRHWATLGPCAW